MPAPVSARSTRGLSCSELCQTREHLDRLLGRMLAGVHAAAESAGGGATGGEKHATATFSC